jgi:hypothetical protein
MLDRLLRGAPAVPVVDELMGAAIGHVLAFSTWQDLTGAQGLDDTRAAELASRLVAVAGFSDFGKGK